MKKIFLSLLLITVLYTVSFAQNVNSYAVVVSFNSLCCGVPSNEPVMKLIKNFKKQNKIKQVLVDSIGPLGREGEYYLAFHLKEFSKAQKLKFVQQLKKTAETMKEQGSAQVKENEAVNKSDISPRASVTTIKL